MKKKINRVTSVFFAVILVLSINLPAFAVELSAERREVKHLLSQLEKANKQGEIPVDMTREDFSLINQRAPEKMSEFIVRLAKTATPIENTFTEEDLLAEAQKEKTRSGERFSYQYDVDTGAVERVNGAEFSAPILSQSSAAADDSLDSGAISPMAYPYYWNETLPSNYHNTRSTCQLFIFNSNGDVFYGSGYRIGKRAIATAGHCVYNTEYFGGWASMIFVIPASSPNNPQMPYGTFISTVLECGGDWKNASLPSDDWGIVTIDGEPNVGYLSLLNAGTGIYNWGIRNQGYPASMDSMYLLRGNVNYVYTNSRLFKTTKPNTVYLGGMSGGPCLEDRDYIIGTFTGSLNNDTEMVFMRIDSWIYNKFMSFR